MPSPRQTQRAQRWKDNEHSRTESGLICRTINWLIDWLIPTRKWWAYLGIPGGHKTLPICEFAAKTAHPAGTWRRSTWYPSPAAPSWAPSPDPSRPPSGVAPLSPAPPLAAVATPPSPAYFPSFESGPRSSSQHKSLGLRHFQFSHTPKSPHCIFTSALALALELHLPPHQMLFCGDTDTSRRSSINHSFSWHLQISRAHDALLELVANWWVRRFKREHPPRSSSEKAILPSWQRRLADKRASLSRREELTRSPSHWSPAESRDVIVASITGQVLKCISTSTRRSRRSRRRRASGPQRLHFPGLADGDCCCCRRPSSSWFVRFAIFVLCIFNCRSREPPRGDRPVHSHILK